MPFVFNAAEVCPNCPFGRCIEDRRVNRVRGRNTSFRFRQKVALYCTFDSFVPGTDSDPEPGRDFKTYMDQFQKNASNAGQHLFGGDFDMKGSAIAKVGGDVFELLEAAAIWNAMAVWNRFMDTGEWPSSVFTMPSGAVATPRRRVAVVKLPRGYDTTKLFRSSVRADIAAHERALREHDMELGLSSPDIVGVRIPDPIPNSYAPFLVALMDLGESSLELLETAHQRIEGTLDQSSFLFAIAVKASTRSDRLYQPLFESNVLKYLIGRVLRGSTFRFHTHAGSFEGADIVGHYKAASLISLMQGGAPARAVDRLYLSERPRDVAQMMLDELVMFPL
jgi:hypothetical protein